MQTEPSNQDDLETYRPTLMKTALALTRNLTEAEDLVQRTFERALLKQPPEHALKNQLGWLRVTMRNLFIDGRRRDVVRNRVMDGQREAAFRATQIVVPNRSDLRMVLEQALEQIPPDMAQALLLVAVEGFSYAEVADVQQVALGTVKSRVARARQALAIVLNEMDKPAKGTDG